MTMMKVDDDKLFVKYTNLRSVLNKKDEMEILIKSTEVDIFGITESWTYSDISYEELHITGFSIFRMDRIVREKTQGGGVYYSAPETR